MSQTSLENFKIDKSNWIKVRLGDLVSEPKETIKDPVAEGIQHVVGLEHIDSENIHLRRSTSIDESTTFTKKFRKGDVLFGRRRAYLKKAAQAEFDGICSGDITVMRAKKGLLPNLLPFIINNDKFFDYAITHSAGGLSPRVKFKDLANFEFTCPPIETQPQLIDLFISLEIALEKYTQVKILFEDFLLATLKSIFDKNAKRLPLLDFCSDSPKYGANASAVTYNNFTRYIRITDIGAYGQLSNQPVSAEINDDNYLLTYGDFLIARTADPGRSYFYRPSDGRCSYAGYLIKFTLDTKKILPEYLYFFTQTKEFRTWINQTTRTGTVSNINSQEFLTLKVPFTDMAKQKEVVSQLNIHFERLRDIERMILEALKLRAALINKVF